jgi:hypothetical protein
MYEVAGEWGQVVAGISMDPQIPVSADFFDASLRARKTVATLCGDIVDAGQIARAVRPFFDEDIEQAADSAGQRELHTVPEAK